MNNTEQIVKEMKKWLEKYNGKFRDGDTFWKMFFKELKEIIEEYCNEYFIEEKKEIEKDIKKFKNFIKLIK